MYKQIIIDKNEIEYLRNKDEKMRMLIDSVDEVNKEYIPDPFIALVNSIVYQQLGYKAAFTIWNRLVELVKEVNYKNILHASFESLRSCGLSRPKISYIKNIAEAVANNQLNFNEFDNMSDDEIIENLVKIKGIGTWTSEMFLIFSLYRKNILSNKDFAIIKGLKWLYNLKSEPTNKQLEKFKDKFSPYNTIVSFYLWEITIRNYFKYENIENLSKLR